MKYHSIRPDEIVALKGLGFVYKYERDKSDYWGAFNPERFDKTLAVISSYDTTEWYQGKLVSKKVMEKSRIGKQAPKVKRYPWGKTSDDELAEWKSYKYKKSIFEIDSRFHGIFGSFQLFEAMQYGNCNIAAYLSKDESFMKKSWDDYKIDRIITLNKFYGAGVVGTQGVTFEKSMIIGVVKPVYPQLTWEIGKLDVQKGEFEKASFLSEKASEFLDVPLVTYDECRKAITTCMKYQGLNTKSMDAMGHARYYYHVGRLVMYGYSNPAVTEEYEKVLKEKEYMK